ncbi:MAG TPA: methyl-accepting chemotaxis protein [Syntrophales bacterium]|nr:methyl-accepting chemotaxis protein [Syntrophales bacterium]
MKKRTLRFKLIAGGVLIVLVPLLTLGILIEMKSSGTLEESAANQVRKAAEANAAMVEAALSSAMKITGQIADGQNIRDATAAATRDGLSETDIASLNRILENTREKLGSDYEALLVTDKKGTVIFDSQNGAYRGSSPENSPAFAKALEGRTTIGDVVKSKTSENPALAILAPVQSPDGETIGVLNVYISLNHLNQTVTGKIGETGYGYAVDQSGLLILHPDTDKVLSTNLFEQHGMEDITKGMKGRRTGVARYIFAGTPKMAGYAPVPSAGWSIGITQNQSELYAPARSIRNFILFTGIFCIVITIGGIFLASRLLMTPIKKAADQVTEAAATVFSSSSQLSAASQELAEGVSEQAASLQETSSSLEEISSIAQQTAENSIRAGNFMRDAQSAAKSVIECLGGLTASMQDVSVSSEQTSKIVKNIDEIAFQTNLLALNAAVEAARAGEAGAGFAVVASEVRNLALRAAESAKNTAGMIEDTVQKIKQGVELVRKTNEAFGQLGKYRTGVTDMIDQITVATKEQAEGIEQVNRAVAEMDKVTQQTSATAEESASTASELSAQSEELTKASGVLLSLVEGNTTDGPSHERRMTGPGSHSHVISVAAGKRKPAIPYKAAS